MGVWTQLSAWSSFYMLQINWMVSWKTTLLWNWLTDFGLNVCWKYMIISLKMLSFVLHGNAYAAYLHAWKYNRLKFGHKFSKTVVFKYNVNNQHLIDGILPKGPYLPCVSMAGRALLAGYPSYQSLMLMENAMTSFSLMYKYLSYFH